MIIRGKTTQNPQTFFSELRRERNRKRRQRNNQQIAVSARSGRESARNFQISFPIYHKSFI